MKKKTLFTSRYLLLAVAAMILMLALTACGGQASTPAPAAKAPEPTATSAPPPTPEPTAVTWGPPAEYAEGTFPVTLSKIKEHKNPWQIKDCFTCHDKQTGGAPEIPHDIYTLSCRQCHVPEEGSGSEY